MKEIKGTDYFDTVSKIIVFKYLKPEEIKKIVSLAKFYSYGPDEKIIAKGELSHNFCSVLSGTVHVVVPEKASSPQAPTGSVFISSIGAGDVFGEAGIFLNVKRTADVVSADDSVILTITREDIIGFIKSRPEAGIKILMLIIYSLLRKLKEANIELAFERKADINQTDIDAMVEEVMRE